MSSSNLIIVICIIIAVLAFVALVAFLACTLIFVMRSLKRTEQLIETSNSIARDVDKKLHAFDPLFTQIHELGRFVEEKKESLRKISRERDASETHERDEKIGKVVELCEWALVGVTIASRFLKKRK